MFVFPEWDLAWGYYGVRGFIRLGFSQSSHLSEAGEGAENKHFPYFIVCPSLLLTPTPLMPPWLGTESPSLTEASLPEEMLKLHPGEQLLLEMQSSWANWKRLACSNSPHHKALLPDPSVEPTDVGRCGTSKCGSIVPVCSA